MNVKRNPHIASALSAAVCCILFFSACGNKKTSSDTGQAAVDTFTTDSISLTDSISTPGGNKAICSISVAYPTEGGTQVLDSVRAWIASSLSTNSYVSTDSDSTPYAVNPSLNTDGKALVSAVMKKVLDSAKPYLLQYDTLNMGFPMTYEYNWNIKKLYQTDKLVTFGNATYAYLGGAHGSAGFNAQVFALEDGAEFGWNMFRPEALDKVRSLVENGIMTQYFKSSTPEEFKQALLLPPGANEFPLPASAPYFMADGVHFDYQQYEIAPYSEGMPSCVLPYSSVHTLLTAEASALLK